MQSRCFALIVIVSALQHFAATPHSICSAKGALAVDYWHPESEFEISIDNLVEWEGGGPFWSNLDTDIDEVDYDSFAIGWTWSREKAVTGVRFEYARAEGRASIRWEQDGSMRENTSHFGLEEYHVSAFLGYMAALDNLRLVPFVGARTLLDEMPLIQGDDWILSVEAEPIGSFIQFGFGALLQYSTDWGLSAHGGVAKYLFSSMGSGTRGLSVTGGLSFFLTENLQLRGGYRYESLEVDESAFDDSTGIQIEQSVERVSTGPFISIVLVF